MQKSVLQYPSKVEFRNFVEVIGSQQNEIDIDKIVDGHAPVITDIKMGE